MLAPGQVALLARVVGTPTLEPPPITTTVTLNVPTLAAGTTTITMSTISSTVVVSTPVLGVVVLLPTITSSSSVGQPTLAPGSVTLALPTITSTGSINVPVVGADFPWPTSISGRYIHDQFGEVWIGKCMSWWAAPQGATDSEIISGVSQLAALGYNMVLAGPCGMQFNASNWGNIFQNDAGEEFFTGAPITTSFGPAWDSMDLLMDECLAAGITVGFSIYWGFPDGFGTQGIGDELAGATNAQARTYGQSIAARYGGYPNLMWHMGADQTWAFGSTAAARIDNVFRGLTETESQHHLIICEPDSGSGTSLTAYSLYISDTDPGVGSTGYGWFIPDVNSFYFNTSQSSAEAYDVVHNQSGATGIPCWDCEPAYLQSSHYSGDLQEHRERTWSVMLRGAWGINFGIEMFCSAGRPTAHVGTPDPDWLDLLVDLDGVDHSALCWALIDQYLLDDTWTPEDAFVTTGTGSGDTKAAVGASDTAAIAYFPNSRTIAVDTTIIAGVSQVRLRWYDPTNGAFTTISAAEAQQTGRSVTHPGNNSAGVGDWVLVVDLAASQTITMATITSTVVMNPFVTSLRVTLPVITSTTTLFGFSMRQQVALPIITSTVVLPSPVLGMGTALPTIASTLVISQPTLTVGPVTALLPTLAAGTSVNQPTLVLSGAIALPTIASTLTLPAPTLTPTLITMPTVVSTLVLYGFQVAVSASAVLRVGAVPVTEAKLGENDVLKMYMGSTQVWP